MRADVYLATTGHARSREAARVLICAGLVTLDGRRITKPSQPVDDSAEHSVTVEQSRENRYVSRGGLKLEAALEAAQLGVTGLRCADIGASTGGFTDCLLKHGASQVCALDSGHGQLDRKLASDARVVNIEGFNARRLRDDDRGGLPDDLDMAVMDVSFISQTYILPGVPSILRPGGLSVSLIKPQFEVGRAGLGKGGIVRDFGRRLEAVMRVMSCADSAGLGFVRLLRSPIEGGDGNREYLLVSRKGAAAPYPGAGGIAEII